MNENKNKNNNIDSSSKYQNNKNKKYNVFQNEFQKIMKFNKKLKDEHKENNNKDNNNKKNPLRIKTEEDQYDNRYENEDLCTDCRYSKNKICSYHRNIYSMPKKYTCNFQNCPENKDKKSFMKYNIKKTNIATTNYTNTDTPKNTPKTSFPDKHKNYNSKFTKDK